MSARVVGIDLSLASTGLADNRGRVQRVQTKGHASDSIADVLRRFNHISLEVVTFATMGMSDPGTGSRYAVADPADLAVVEGPAYSRGAMGGQHSRAGLWWLVAERLDICGIPILVVPPTTRAMYATGKGNSGKDAVLAAAIKRYPAWDITGNDIADAAILASIGSRLLGHPVEDSLPQANLRALDKLTLPFA